MFPYHRLCAHHANLAERDGVTAVTAYGLTQHKKGLVRRCDRKYAGALDRMALSSVTSGLWLAGLSLQALLAITLLGKKAWKIFPVVTAYSVYNLVEDAVAYALRHHHVAYAYFYFIGESIAVMLGLALVYEIFRQLFYPHPALRALAARAFQVVLVSLVLLGIALFYFRSPSQGSGVVSALMVVEEAARTLEVGLIMFLFVFSSVFGLHWRQQLFGITLGFGILTAVKLAVVALAPHAGSAAGALVVAAIVSFDLSLLIWLGYFMAPERVVATAEMPKRAQLEQWNQAILELIHQ